MASQDVIELGSSDEEAKPAAKKANRAKIKPNAMVHIPAGVTVKPSNPGLTTINKLIGKGVTITKVNKVNKLTKVNQLPNVARNGKMPLKSPVIYPAGIKIQNIKSLGQNIEVRSVASTVLNPLSLGSANNKPSNKTVHKLSNKIIKKTINTSVSNAYKYPLKVQNVKALNSLTFPNLNKISASKRSTTASTSNATKKQKVSTSQDVLTVDLDDDEPPATFTSSPQWYLRPEDSSASETAALSENIKETAALSENIKETAAPSETINEKEHENISEPSKFIEITIEDSPVKPVHNKRIHEVDIELPITIDESPVKTTASKAPTPTSSDNERQESGKKPKGPHSKKRLNYPKNVETRENMTIEIELEPISSETFNEETNKANNTNKQIKEVKTADCVIEVLESPLKIEETAPGTPKKEKCQSQAKVKPIQITPQKVTPEEFHPTYQEFIDLCLKIENSSDMKTIVEKKIKNYYKQVPKEYTESEEFIELVQSKIMAMKVGPEKLYLYIKDVVDELNLQRKMAQAKPAVKETRNLEAEKFQYGEESEFDSKRQRQIRKLEKTLKKLHRAIQKLEEQEVDFDDEEDSVYLLTERYKERMVRVHAKFCQLTNTKMPSEPRIQVEPRPGQPAGPAKRLEKWVNKKVPIGTPLPFPDFHDVLRCVREANAEDQLGWNEADVMEEARDLFTRCGKKLQRRRQENEWRLAASRISNEVDPAEKSDELKRKLENSKQLATKKEADVFNKFADKQSQLKLEAEEIGDKEAEESPVESEEEDAAEDNSNLENKEKRKERLRKLLEEKSKKTNRNNDELEDPENTISQNNPAEKNDDKSKENLETENDNNTEPKSMEVDGIQQDGTEENMEVDSVTKGIDGESEQLRKNESNEIYSDVDELHLLEKLHSDEMNTSTVDSSYSDSPIDISDSLSSSDNKKRSSDVISIENSTYSESETRDGFTGKSDKMEIDDDVGCTEKPTGRTELEFVENADSEKPSEEFDQTNKDEKNESIESILIGTSDEDVENHGDEGPINDDVISIIETNIQKADGDEKITCDLSPRLPTKENTHTTEVSGIESNVLESSTKIGEQSVKTIETPSKEDNSSIIEIEPICPDNLMTLDSVGNTQESVSAEKSESAITKTTFHNDNEKMITGNDQEPPETNFIEILIEPETTRESKSPHQDKNSTDSIEKTEAAEGSTSLALQEPINENENSTVMEVNTANKCYSKKENGKETVSEQLIDNSNLNKHKSDETNLSTEAAEIKPNKEPTENTVAGSGESCMREETLDSMLEDLQSDLALDSNIH